MPNIRLKVKCKFTLINESFQETFFAQFSCAIDLNFLIEFNENFKIKIFILTKG